jgi:HSP20 family protein
MRLRGSAAILISGRCIMTMPAMQQRTTTARWDPFRELQQFFSELQGSEGGTGEGGRPESFIPIADVEERDDSYVIELDLPGVKKDDIDISMAGRRLVVTGQRKEKERVGILRRRDRLVGEFRFEIELPNEIDDSHVQASLDDGVLTLTVPKRQADQPRRIAVS